MSIAQKHQKSSKTVFVGIGLVLFGAAVYYFYWKPSNRDTPDQLATATSVTPNTSARPKRRRKVSNF